MAKHENELKASAAPVLQKNLRDTFEALCAMRDSINECIPVPSLESDLLQGPETSVFCATVAQSVIAAVSRERCRFEAIHEASKALMNRWPKDQHDGSPLKTEADALRAALVAEGSAE